MTQTLDLDGLVAATPTSRDRLVDLLRALSIGVVILWHWVFSVTFVDRQGTITMPNPVGDVRLMWLATWLFQIMPVFFFVGGFSNLASWEALERRGGARWSTFARRRLGRLLRPIAAFAAVWVAVDAGGRLFVDGYESVLAWGASCSCRSGSSACTPPWSCSPP